jgi:uncharacterized membrane protein YkgB
MTLETFDLDLIHFFRRASVPVARFGLFVVFFWFGLLKVLGESPASPLVQHLFSSTLGQALPFLSFPTFLILFGLFECLIGILFLIPGCERLVTPLLVFHMITTIMPLFALPETTWTGFLMPTLEGQYIIKNLLIIAAAIGIAAHLHPLAERHASQSNSLNIGA